MPAWILTQKRLKELLHYNQITGVFTRKVTTSNNKAKKGDIAGSGNNGYLMFYVDRKLYLAHRLAFLYMTGRFPPDQVDHRNHVRNDNRWVNLRPADHTVNGKNTKLPATNTSGRIGVSWDKNNNKWVAYIRANKQKHIHLGRYTSFKKACAARNAAERKYGFHVNHGK